MHSSNLPAAAGQLTIEHFRNGLATELSDLSRCIRCESPSSNKEAVLASARLIAEIGTARLGTAPDEIVVDGRTHLRWRFGQGRRRVILLCHHDTVWPIGSLAAHPYSVESGVLRGPGSYDMKTGLIGAIHALAALRGCYGTLDGITLLVTGDEEIGSPTSRPLIEAEAAGCDAALVMEAAGPDGALKTARKGISIYSIDITGHAAHAGTEPERGVNASVELARQILAVSQLGDPALGTTVTPTVASSGTTGNTVPATARLAIDARALTTAEQERVDRAVAALTPALPGSTLNVGGGINRPPLEESSGIGLFRRAERIASVRGLTPLDHVGVGGASDGNFTAGIGVPTLDGLGAVGGGAHADDEHALVEKIPERTALIAWLVADVLGLA
ncbi:M20 family metallopeptidase [Spelaeicoccus albus]|uniref:Glutamate carboxypeptidase n=1 Tax=Spelaeicoccus albus TaxID=1280376 RepID=A0A7Z0D0R5_9MICO|nr:M20 family metallopeptidase [Spelaeicoccus albus]NYI65708.1 glutamate carboxypeptidase [Spelaeicoccus albus]